MESQGRGNTTLTLEDLMDYTGGDENEVIPDEPVMFDTDEFYQDLFTLGDQNFSGINLGDLDSSDLVLGGEASGLMVTYMTYRPHILGTLVVLASIVGVCANITLLILVLRKGWELLSFASILIVNLAFSCLLFLLGGIPLLLVENVFGYGWQLGEVICQVHRYIIYVSLFVISYAVVGVLVHQTVALYRPDHVLKVENPGYAIAACLSLWTLILVANVPNYLGHGVTEEIAGISYCYNKEIHQGQDRMQEWTILHFVFSFALPFLLMCVCAVATMVRLCCRQHSDYNRLRDNPLERRDYATLAIVVTLVFALCWAPDKIFSLMLVLHPHRMDAPTLIASDVMMILAYSNPTINPLLILGSGMRELKHSTASNGAIVKRTITETSSNGKVDHSTSLPLCPQEEPFDPEMITTV